MVIFCRERQPLVLSLRLQALRRHLLPYFLLQLPLFKSKVKFLSLNEHDSLDDPTPSFFHPSPSSSLVPTQASSYPISSHQIPIQASSSSTTLPQSNWNPSFLHSNFIPSNSRPSFLVLNFLHRYPILSYLNSCTNSKACFIISWLKKSSSMFCGVQEYKQSPHLRKPQNSFYTTRTSCVSE